MLSILIPTYNYNVLPLVTLMHKQAMELQIEFEILVFDDCSEKLYPENQEVNGLEHCEFRTLPYNIGRSAIRNLLATKSRYETLLFMDADVKPHDQFFLKRYLDASGRNDKSQIIYGGIIYPKELNTNENSLRLIYGKKREALPLNKRIKQPYLRFLTLSFLIKKTVFEHIEFRERIPNLRHEDTLFAMDAKDHGINLIHINNPVVHFGLEPNSIFLNKSLESDKVLKKFIDEGLINKKDIKLSRVAMRIENLNIAWLAKTILGLFSKLIRKNLVSKNPSLFLFDCYRLEHYLKL